MRTTLPQERTALVLLIIRYNAWHNFKILRPAYALKLNFNAPLIRRFPGITPSRNSLIELIYSRPDCRAGPIARRRLPRYLRVFCVYR